eukprot:GHVU01222692.1.p1 GENE.GHVU01222692.1~~GHVU01222692.1.p1  ORF type:complete len:145 (-),score=18.86 GHVU01222692.1:6-440(-)
MVVWLIAIQDVFSWQNTVTSSCALVACNVFWLLIYAAGWSVLSMLCYDVMMLMGLGLLASAVFHEQINPAKDVEIISEDMMAENILYYCDILNKYGSKGRSLLLWQDKKASLKLLGALFGLSAIFSHVNFAFLLLLGQPVAFLL